MGSIYLQSISMPTKTAKESRHGVSSQSWLPPSWVLSFWRNYGNAVRSTAIWLALSPIGSKRSLQTRNRFRCKSILLRSKFKCPKTIKIKYNPQPTHSSQAVLCRKSRHFVLWSCAIPKNAPHESAHGLSCVAAPYLINQEIARQCQLSSFQIINVENRRGTYGATSMSLLKQLMS